ncbi:DsbC family protein [Wenzhouxiangella limi]|uniref:Thiol:disulfide interchange protein n=1 Tax=Wenzhouxiangella limi TaxID=2707351 RepID=A0A845VCG1_9GAMM|nr:DsbC family protein [Wenzhouxiangella limi]NDY94959.1 DsbC family protein [Wenzhouxiangella limi]
MKPINLSGLALAGVILAASAVAADPAAIEERLSALVPDTSEVAIAETPLPGIMEVRVGSDIIYMSDDGRYLFQGRVIDLETQQDLTDAAMADVRREQIDELERSEFVTFGEDDAEYEVLVFTDPDCGFCQRLHEKMDEYHEAGIRIHYLAFPRAGEGSQTYNKMVSVWCADDRQAAMDVAKSGGTPRAATCPNPVLEQYQLGQSLGVTGTPSMMTFDGDMIPGYVPPDQLRQRLETLAAGNGSP